MQSFKFRYKRSFYKRYIQCGGKILQVKGLNIDGVIKVDNARVYGLEESIIASGYPMQVDTYDLDEDELDEKESRLIPKDIKRAKHLGNAVPGSGHDCFLKGIIVQFDLQVPEYIWRQLDRYHFIDYVSSQSKMHRILKMDIDKACNKYVDSETLLMLEMYINAYNNFDTITKLVSVEVRDLDIDNLPFIMSSREEEGKILNEWFEDFYIERFTYDIEDNQLMYELRKGEYIPFTKENLFNMIIANTPCGLMLTARMTTNYLQLKSIINQRSNHKMQEWRYLCDWFKTLPMLEELVCKSRC